MPDTRTVRAVISGRVQGVWYRGWTVDQATALGLTGWVRNNPDGTVEALFHGPAATVDTMLANCRSGPPLARVDDIRVTDTNDAAPQSFSQRP